MTLKWQFELLDETGKPLVQLAETTDGPQRFANTAAADTAIDALLETVMERIATSIKDTPWEQAPSQEVAASNQEL